MTAFSDYSRQPAAAFTTRAQDRLPLGTPPSVSRAFVKLGISVPVFIDLLFGITQLERRAPTPSVVLENHNECEDDLPPPQNRLKSSFKFRDGRRRGGLYEGARGGVSLQTPNSIT